jgi:uncharacterized protein involved in outer membrane biogenesis
VWQQFLEDRISSAVGASVSFEKLSVSPFRGVVDGSRLVARPDETSTPFLTIERVQLKVKMSELLAKRLVIETVLLERPTVTVERAADGKLNVPIPATKPPALPADGEGDGSSSPWAAGIRQVLLTEGSVRYRDQSIGFDGYTLEAGPINLQLDQAPGKPATMTGNVAAIRRIDQPAELGSLLITGEGSGLEQLSDLRQLTGRVTAEIRNLLRVELDATATAIRATVHVTLTASGMWPLLPPGIIANIPSFLMTAQSDLTLTTSWNR